MVTARMTRTADGLSYRVTFPFDPDVVAGIKAAVPPHSRTYDPDEKAWYVAIAYTAPVRRLLEATFMQVEMDTERTTYTSPPPPDRAPQTSYTVLHLQPTAPPELIESAYRTLSRLHHPDQGGDTETMQAINAAVAILRKGREP
jgi:hypothetical protein